MSEKLGFRFIEGSRELMQRLGFSRFAGEPPTSSLRTYTKPLSPDTQSVCVVRFDGIPGSSPWQERPDFGVSLLSPGDAGFWTWMRLKMLPEVFERYPELEGLKERFLDFPIPERKYGGGAMLMSDWKTGGYDLMLELIPKLTEIGFLKKLLEELSAEYGFGRRLFDIIEGKVKENLPGYTFEDRYDKEKRVVFYKPEKSKKTAPAIVLEFPPYGLVIKKTRIRVTEKEGGTTVVGDELSQRSYYIWQTQRDESGLSLHGLDISNPSAEKKIKFILEKGIEALAKYLKEHPSKES